jgi:CheY-like chemotaxis protein
MARILLIDDEDTARGDTAATLRGLGHEVVAEASGIEALRRIGRMNGGAGFDMVLTEILMPDVDGLEIIRNLRRSHPGCPVIAMSDDGRRVDARLSLSLAAGLGAAATLMKPFTATELRETVQDLCPAPVG